MRRPRVDERDDRRPGLRACAITRGRLRLRAGLGLERARPARARRFRGRSRDAARAGRDERDHASAAEHRRDDARRAWRAAVDGLEPARAAGEVGDREGVAGPVWLSADRAAPGPPRRRRPCRRSHRRAPWVTSTSGTPSAREVAEHLGLLVAQLQHARRARAARGRSRRRVRARRAAPGRTSPWPSSESRRPRASAASVAAGKSLRSSGATCTQPTVAWQRRAGRPGASVSPSASTSMLPLGATLVDREARGRLAGDVVTAGAERDDRRQQLVAVGAAQRA